MSKHYSQQFKDEAVHLFNTKYHSNYDLASEGIGVSTHALRMWSGYYKVKPTKDKPSESLKSPVVEAIMEGYAYKAVSEKFTVPVGTVATWVYQASTSGVGLPKLSNLITD